MTKRVIDLSVDELAAMGAKAAHLAVRRAQQAGVTITGTIDTYDDGQAASSLAQLLPSGTVTLVQEGEPQRADKKSLAGRRDRNKVLD